MHRFFDLFCCCCCRCYHHLFSFYFRIRYVLCMCMLWLDVTHILFDFVVIFISVFFSVQKLKLQRRIDIGNKPSKMYNIDERKRKKKKIRKKRKMKESCKKLCETKLKQIVFGYLILSWRHREWNQRCFSPFCIVSVGKRRCSSACFPFVPFFLLLLFHISHFQQKSSFRGANCMKL